MGKQVSVKQNISYNVLVASVLYIFSNLYMQVQVPSEVKKVVCGVDHTMVLSQAYA